MSAVTTMSTNSKAPSTSTTSTTRRRRGWRRLDLGSVLIPMPEAGQVQVELTEMGVPSAVWVVTPNGRFTIAAYAAPKTAGLWREVATELADSLRKDVPKVSIEDGPWGREIVGVVEGRAGPAARRRPVHRRRRLSLDDPMRRQRPAGQDRGAGRRSAECVGGHRCSARRDADAGPHPAAGATARADGGAAARGGGTGRPAAGSTGTAAQQQPPPPSPSLAGASLGRPCSSCGPSPAARSHAGAERRPARPGTRAPNTAGSAPISTSVTVRSASVARPPPIRCRLRPDAPDRRWRRPRPSGRPDPPAGRRSARHNGRPRPSRRAAQATARPRTGSARRPAMPGWTPASARWPTPSPSRRSISAECRAARAAGAVSGSPVQAGRAASTATVCPGWASAHAAATAAPMDTPPTRDRGGPCRVVERIAVAVDEPVRLRGRRHDDRPDIVQGIGKRPVDVVVVGSGAGQQNRRDTAQIDRHQTIVPCSSTRRRGDPAPRGISEPTGLPWRWIG